MLFQAVLCPGTKLIYIPAGVSHTTDRNVEIAAFDHRLQGRKDLLVSQIAGSTEEYEGVGTHSSHVCLFQSVRQDIPNSDAGTFGAAETSNVIDDPGNSPKLGRCGNISQRRPPRERVTVSGRRTLGISAE
jgi:hypothetical protein